MVFETFCLHMTSCYMVNDSNCPTKEVPRLWDLFRLYANHANGRGDGALFQRHVGAKADKKAVLARLAVWSPVDHVQRCIVSSQ